MPQNDNALGVRPDNHDPDRFFAPGGAVESLVAAQKAGKSRYIGFTGHKDPQVHLYMLELARKHNFHFDTIQMPLNVMDARHRSFSAFQVAASFKALSQREPSAILNKTQPAALQRRVRAIQNFRALRQYRQASGMARPGDPAG